MVQATAIRSGPDGNSRIAELSYPDDAGRADFTRADLIFTGVDHAHVSYEVRIFLNNPEASVQTVRTESEGYAGRFHVFGHGGCYGDVGHCDVPAPSTDPTDMRPPHPLTPLSTYVTITAALRRMLESAARPETVTMVPISLTPRRQDRGPAPHLFTFQSVELQLYLTPSNEAPLA